MLNKFKLVLLVVSLTLVFTGCETFKELGKGIQKAGEEIERAATKKPEKQKE